MTARAKALLDQVLQLPEKERARLALALLESIDEEPEPRAAEEWAAEVEWRARRPDPPGIPWPEVRKRMTKPRRR